MKPVLYPDELSASCSAGSPADELVPDGGRWLAAVQSGLHTDPDAVRMDGHQPPGGDQSPRPSGDSPDFSAPDSSSAYTR